VLLGETQEYEPLSRAAFYKARLKEKLRTLDVKEPEEISPNNK